MRTKRVTVTGQLNKVLNTRVELGGLTEFRLIQSTSESDVDSFVRTFRADYAHLISYPFKDSTVNRGLEKWIKANKHRF